MDKALTHHLLGLCGDLARNDTDGFLARTVVGAWIGCPLLAALHLEWEAALL